MNRHEWAFVAALVIATNAVSIGVAKNVIADHDAAHQRELHAVTDETVREHVTNLGLSTRVAQLEAELRSAQKARASRSRRLSAQGTPAGHGDSEGSRQSNGPVQGGGWAHTTRAIKIANCESADLQHWPYSDGSRYLGGEKGIHLRDANGHYGKWQFALSTWRSVGGTGNPADASEAEQDMRANVLHARDGETPWSCRLKV